MKLSILASISCAAAFPAVAQNDAGYHIGNSLTLDSRPPLMGEFAADQGIALATGHHINCNRSLNEIAANPTQTCINVVPGFGYYQDALANVDLDYFTAQPFWTLSSTMASDVQVISDMEALLSTNPASDEAVVFLYQAWGADWFMKNGSWHQNVANEDSVQTTPADQYFFHLFDRVTAALPSRDVRLIPVGRVINAINDRIVAEDMPGITDLSQIYRDDIHMSYTLGRFTAAITTACVVLDRSPIGMHRTWFDHHSDGGYGLETYIAIENIVWDVVSGDSRTGVKPCLGDTNRDGMISPTDFTAWLDAYSNGYTAADQNRDGMISPTDFTAWLDAYNQGCP